MLFILLLIAATVYYFINNNNKNKIVKCNIDSDDSCKMYNERDIRSKCSSMCIEQDKNYVFTGQYKKVNDDHVCECDYSKDKFTNINENPDILPDAVPSDVKFSDRNYLEKEQEKRYGGLIFGIVK
jgi:hypothetical protein